MAIVLEKKVLYSFAPPEASGGTASRLAQVIFEVPPHRSCSRTRQKETSMADRELQDLFSCFQDSSLLLLGSESLWQLKMLKETLSDNTAITIAIPQLLTNSNCQMGKATVIQHTKYYQQVQIYSATHFKTKTQCNALLYNPWNLSS